MKFRKNLITGITAIMLFIAPFTIQAQLSVNCEVIQSISSGDTMSINTSLVTYAQDRDATDNNVTYWGINGFNSNELQGLDIDFDTVVALNCFIEYKPTNTKTGYRYLTHADNIRALKSDGDKHELYLVRPHKNISVINPVAIRTAWALWKTLQGF